MPTTTADHAAAPGRDDPPATTAAPHMQAPTVTPLLRQRLRGRFAALSVIGGVMVALPLLQVLRYQNAEVQSLATERAGLDPAGRAVEVQRSLLAHRDVAAEVLRGKAALEAERLVRQGEVDDRVGALAVALANGVWERAIKESDALREDWSLLARLVAQRSVNAAESDQAHRLLVEQSLQVVDLVAEATLPRANGLPQLADAGPWWRPADGGSWWQFSEQDLARRGDGGAGTLATLAAAQALPRLAWQLALLAAPALPAAPASDGVGSGAVAGDAAAAQRELAAAEADVARTLGAMNTAVDRQQAPAAQLTLAHATAAAGAAADHYFSVLRRLPQRAAGDADVQAAAAAAVHAQLQLFDMARRAIDDQLGEQAAAAELRRSLFVSTMAVLALAALALISSLARRLRCWQQAALAAAQEAASVRIATADDGAARNEPTEAHRLLQRLRAGSDRHPPQEHVQDER